MDYILLAVILAEVTVVLGVLALMQAFEDIAKEEGAKARARLRNKIEVEVLLSDLKKGK